MAKMERFEDFVTFAIEQERAAAALYESAAARVQSTAGRELFREMAAMERVHEVKLVALRATGMATLPQHGEVRDLRISEFLVAQPLSPDASLQEVFVFAMKAEQKAHALYTGLAAMEVGHDIRELLQSLAAEELRHKRDLETEYERTFMRDN